jgi:CotH kinase protein/Lamin Tail Domain
MLSDLEFRMRPGHQLNPLRALCLCAGLLASAQVAFTAPAITEFMASNKTTLADEDGSYPDWLEIYNPDETPVSLLGWYLTDNAKKPTKWQFPDVTVAPHGYLVVFASGKDRRDPTRPLHTNFDLAASGEYLGLIEPDGITAASEYAPIFPAQVADISYGITQPTDPNEMPQRGYLGTPTPGAPNGGAAALSLPSSVMFSRPAGTFSGMVSLELGGASGSQRIHYVLVPPSTAGARLMAPTANDPLYTGPIALNSSVIVCAEVFSPDDLQHGPIAAAQYVQVATAGVVSLANFSSRLPVFLLDDHGFGDFIVGDQSRPAWLHLFNPNTGTDAVPMMTGVPALALPVSAKIRGYSSANFPKKSFNFTLQDANGADNSQTLLGLPVAADWAIVSPWNYDRAFVRNPYVYALGNLLGHWSPHSQFVEMFVNTDCRSLDNADYAGVSFLVERIKIAPNRVNITPMSSTDISDSAITGGYILKIDDASSDSFTWSTSRGIPSAPGTAINVDSVKADKLAPEQSAYIKNYVQSMEDALFADHASGWATRRYLDYIDLPSWVDYHLLNVFVFNVDALQRSVYFTKDRGGKLVAGPLWDYDRCMGSADGRDADPASGWAPTGTPDPWNFDWWGELSHDPDFIQAWVDRWQGLRRSELADVNLTALADTIAAQVDPQAAARDAARWPDDESRYPGGFNGEITHIKDWITQRAAWIDQRFVALPTAEFNAQKLIITPPDGAQLAYTLDGSDPRASGGNLAPGAVLTSEALSIDLASNPNVRVRTYDARYADIFPSSPWSSLARLADLPKSSRLVNLSSRGYVGTGDAAMLSGVVVRGPMTKRFLARGIGPGLAAFGVADALTDPTLKIYASDGTVVTGNEGWEQSADVLQLPAISSSVGAFPLAAGSSDSALIVDLPPGSYTLSLSSSSGQPGVGLAELYELDSTASRAVNLSTRAYVKPGDKALIGGLVVSGPATKRVLVRAVGPALTAFGVTGAIADPVLTVFDSNQAVVGKNDDWGDGSNPDEVAAAAVGAGAFALPSGSKDAAFILTLTPGNYTLQMTGKDGDGGLALLEVYELPDK